MNGWKKSGWLLSQNISLSLHKYIQVYIHIHVNIHIYVNEYFWPNDENEPSLEDWIINNFMAVIKDLYQCMPFFLGKHHHQAENRFVLPPQRQSLNYKKKQITSFFFTKQNTRAKLHLSSTNQTNKKKSRRFSFKKQKLLRLSQIPSLRRVWISSISHLILALQFNSFLSQVIKTSFWHAPTSS